MPQVTATAASSPAIQADVLTKIGVYQLLKHSGATSHPAFTDKDFSIIEITTRSQLDVMAALVAEPWLLARKPALNDRVEPIYVAGAGETQNQAVIALIDELLNTLA